MNRREALLSGVGAAAALHDDLSLRDRLKAGDAPVDVFSIIENVGVPLAFRPLQGLLGLFLPPPAGPGIMITTERPLHLQRFTAAHELGHFMLQHEHGSFDERIGFVARGDYSRDQLQEVAADAFAAEFMLPRWLLVAHARKRGWSAEDLRSPDVVYQLSLRLGLSYEATCLALANHGIVPSPVVESLRAVPPKITKQKALGKVKPPSWWSDVWVLSANDAGAYMLGNPDDIIVLSLEEHAASGYTWDISQAEANGFSIILDERRDRNDAGLGSIVDRLIVLHAQGGGHVSLVEKRAWSKDHPLNELGLDLSFWGKETLPRVAALDS